MLKMGYMVTHGPWLSKQSEIIIHFNIIIKIMKHFLGSVTICGSVRGLFFTRNLHPIVPRKIAKLGAPILIFIFKLVIYKCLSYFNHEFSVSTLLQNTETVLSYEWHNKYYYCYYYNSMLTKF